MAKLFFLLLPLTLYCVGAVGQEANGGVDARKMRLTELVPVPDPTTLTTEALKREVLGLKEVIFTRLEAMDRALILFSDSMTRVPTDTDKQIAQLRQLQDEKFASIAKQFEERDTRTEQTSRDSKVAVDAALQAAKEAVGEQNKSSALAIAKSETAIMKQIDQLLNLFQTTTAALNDKIDDGKARLTLIEGKGFGREVQISGQKEDNSFIVAIAVALISFVGLLFVMFRQAHAK